MILKKKILIFSVFFVFLFPLTTKADVVGDTHLFFVDQKYDIDGRDSLSATMRSKSINSYFYIEDSWWNRLDQTERDVVLKKIETLGREFDSVIYPKLRMVLGKEWRLGVDGNRHISVLIHRMQGKSQGYVRSNDEYFQSHVSNSNEREMLYLDTDAVLSPRATGYLSHEFSHLITFNQKDRLRDVSEEIWLNEGRAELATTIAGYNTPFSGSVLEDRKHIFLSFPSDSITEWRGEASDYGALSIFMNYLAEKYGTKVILDSQESNLIGIPSIEYALRKNGYSKSFGEIFSDWLIASYANNCSLGEKYCYQQEGLQNLKVNPQILFLPLNGSSNLGVSEKTKNWSGNWFKFVGGKPGSVQIDFIGNPENVFRVPYLIQYRNGKYGLGKMQLSSLQRGSITISGFGSDVSALIIMPSVQTKKNNFLKNEKTVPFFFEATTVPDTSSVDKKNSNVVNNKYIDLPINEMSTEEISFKISQLEQLLTTLRQRLNELQSSQNNCQRINTNLWLGVRNNAVRCLQSFLKEEGVYPAGLVTGYYGPLTYSAVKNFQEKYASEILLPLGLEGGTGYVGSLTLQKINHLLTFPK